MDRNRNDCQVENILTGCSCALIIIPDGLHTEMVDCINFCLKAKLVLIGSSEITTFHVKYLILLDSDGTLS